MNVVRLGLRIGLPLLVLAVGGMTARKLVKARQEAKKVAPQERGALVATIEVDAAPTKVRVQARGRVLPARSLALMAQVGGRITDLHPEMVPGGRLAAGTTLVRIERRDYDLAINEARARVAQAEQNQELEAGRQAVATREWRLLGKGVRAGEAARRRALRKPQEENSVAAVNAANAVLSRARLNASRTRLDAPFNALVTVENLEVGQVVNPGAVLARLVGTDAFWIQISVPAADLSWIPMGATARVVHRAGPRVVERVGEVVRLLGELDPRGSMARLLVQVADPLGLKEGREPLLLGAFVEVEIEGRSTGPVYEIPRVAHREQSRVWLVDADNRLAFAHVQVLRRLRESVLVSGGLRDGDRVVTSRLPSPVPGMKLRLKPSSAAAAPRAEAN